VHHPVVIPDLRRTIRHALPNVVEGKIVPVVLFVAFLNVIGNIPALLVTLAWSTGSLGYRWLTGRRIPGLIILGAVAVTARTLVAIATGSMLIYFLQPTLTTVFVGLAFLISVPLGTPLAQKLAYDLLPFDDATKAHPLVRRFFVRMSMLWAVTSLANASVTVWLLLSQSTTTFVLVKSVLGPATAAVTIGLMLVWLQLTVRRTGTAIVWTRSSPTLALA
jgi:hypothetical protein